MDLNKINHNEQVNKIFQGIKKYVAGAGSTAKVDTPTYVMKLSAS